ncbi:MAG: MerR family DNA-binding transcriptional regulator [Cuspidothrix sp.]
MSDFMFKPHEFAKKIGVAVKTLQRWDVKGRLPAKRTLSGHRFYTKDMLDLDSKEIQC